MGFVFRRVSSSRSDHLAVRWFARQILFANGKVGGNLADVRCCFRISTGSGLDKLGARTHRSLPGIPIRAIPSSSVRNTLAT